MVEEIHENSHQKASTVVFLARLVYFIFGVIVAFIVLRMVLLLLAANHGNAFVDFVYGISGIFVAPFYGVFGYTPTFGASIFDISSLVAIVVYALISWGLVTLITLGTRHPEEAI